MKAAIVALTALLATGGSLMVLTAPAPILAQAEAVTETAVFAIENMTCELCPLTVKTAMQRVPGVTSVLIDFGAKTATVTFDPATATIEAIAAAATSVGYPAHIAGF